MATITPRREKPFPWKCGNCNERAVVRTSGAYSVKYEYDGRSYLLEIPEFAAPRCANCGEMVLDSPATRRLDQALRDLIGLLSPEQIRANREALGLTQEQLATSLGIAAATISRWESGHQIQQRAMDRLLRLYFALPSVRSSLGDEAHLSELGTMVGVNSLTS